MKQILCYLVSLYRCHRELKTSKLPGQEKNKAISFLFSVILFLKEQLPDHITWELIRNADPNPPESEYAF